ncbi:hypothetical protein, partial [Enterovibrio norvegicus]|uniref:hypothetical protein n=1 Tax=Enterovibrio norvegicus TaxID=188144 RepID=UPI00352C409D
VSANAVMGMILTPTLEVKTTLSAAHQELPTKLRQFFSAYERGDYLVMALNGASGSGHGMSSLMMEAPTALQTAFMRNAGTFNAGGAGLFMLSGEDIVMEEMVDNDSWPLDIKKWLYQQAVQR